MELLAALITFGAFQQRGSEDLRFRGPRSFRKQHPLSLVLLFRGTQPQLFLFRGTQPQLFLFRGTRTQLFLFRGTQLQLRHYNPYASGRLQPLRK